jgi:hypothetical protein
MMRIIEDSTAAVYHHEDVNIILLRNAGKDLWDAEQAGVEIMVQTRIQEVPGLNLGRTPVTLFEVFMAFLSPSKQMPG